MNIILLLAALLLNVFTYFVSTDKKFIEEAILCTVVLFSFYYFQYIIYSKKNILSYLFIGISVLLLAYNQVLGLVIYFFYGNHFTDGYALSIMNADSKEALSMLKELPLAVFVFLVLAVFQYFVVKKFPLTVRNKSLKFFLASIWLLLPLVSMLLFSFKGGAADLRLVQFFRNNVFYNAKPFIHSMLQFQDGKEIFAADINYDHLKRSVSDVQTIVLVIGESARRQNMSLYSYEKLTTPEQDKRRDAMRIYTKMISSAPVTLISVPMLLSNITPEKFLNEKSQLADNVLGLANHLGYSTYWLSTQENRGRIVATINNMAKFAHQQEWYAGYDEMLLEPFEKILKEDKGKRFIVFHLNGSHGSACDRFPADQAFFSTGNNNLDCYNNSIRYTDKIMGKIFSRLAQENASVIYLSDHGQKYEGNRFFHADSKEASQVPYYVWYGDAVKDSLKDIRVVADQSSLTVNYYEIAKLMGVINLEMPKFEPLMYLRSDHSLIEYKNLAP